MIYLVLTLTFSVELVVIRNLCICVRECCFVASREFDLYKERRQTKTWV